MVFDDEIDSNIGQTVVGKSLPLASIDVTIPENGDNSNDKRDVYKLEKYYLDILNEIGEDTNRQGLKKTPERAAKAILDFTKGYGMTTSGNLSFS
jgi:GTP cyclohydrolase I